MMRRLRHENIVSYLGAEIRGPHLYIFQEWVPGGSAAALIKRFGPLGESVARCYGRQVLSGLAYLHSHQIAHRDIKGANVLIDASGTAKLADFGTSVYVLDHPHNSSSSGGATGIQGTPYFMAPEVMRGRAHGLAVDIWSFAGTILQMVTGAAPWSGSGAATPGALLRMVAAAHDARAPPPLP
ncbi:kinase-like domain-containing protein, partial [Tribonema minus]